MGQSHSIKKGKKKMPYVVGDRVVVNQTADWEGHRGVHGKVTQLRADDPDSFPAGKEYSVWLDGRPGFSPYFAESELDPEV